MAKRILCVVTIALALGAAPAFADPISSSGPAPSLPAFQGKAAKAHPIKGTTKPPQNPFLARNPFSNIHDDTWMTDSYRYQGPLGRSLVATSAAKPPRVCGSIAFDKAGRLVSVCPSVVGGPQARVMDPNTLETLSTYDLPDAPNTPGTKLYQNFTGGGYFFLDNRDRMWVPTKTDHIFVLTVGSDGSLTKTGDYDLTGVLDAANERITSVLPDFKGRMWFVTKQNGKVGTLNPNTGAVRIRTLGEEVENSFAMGKKGVFIASDKRMYRFDAAKNGAPKITWKAGYKNSGIVKPGQVDAGTGTTPTIMKAATSRSPTTRSRCTSSSTAPAELGAPGQATVVCQVPVFGKFTGDTENSLLGVGRSLIVENNYGYQDPFGPEHRRPPTPGFARVEVDKDGKGSTGYGSTTTRLRQPSCRRSRSRRA